VVERCPKERALGFYENGKVVVNGKKLQSVLFVKKNIQCYDTNNEIDIPLLYTKER